VPGRSRKILAITGDDPIMRLARVDFGARREINLVTPEAEIGAYVPSTSVRYHRPRRGRGRPRPSAFR
jgi:hypothetical protein